MKPPHTCLDIVVQLSWLFGKSLSWDFTQISFNDPNYCSKGGKKDSNWAIGTLVRQNFLNGGAFRAKGNDEQSCLKKPPFMSLFPLERAA